MTAKTLIDIKSGKGSIYAPKGAIITVIKQSHNEVWICEYNGEKFPCSPKNLSYDTKQRNIP